jgi:hypothetical protein
LGKLYATVVYLSNHHAFAHLHCCGGCTPYLGGYGEISYICA